MPSKQPAPQVTPAELRVILAELERTLDASAPGDIVEFGCYRGDTSLKAAQLLHRKTPDSKYGTWKKMYLYDSFEGLPEKSREDRSPAGTQFDTGELLASKSGIIKRFKHAHLPLPIIKKAWFADLTPADLPAQISFAFLDGDYYDSIRASLRLVVPRLTPSSTVIVHDYQNQALPGVAKAVDEFLLTHPRHIRVTNGLAILTS